MAKGGFTGAVPPRETSPEEYSGVWDITEQYGEQKAGSWPFQADDNAPKSLRFGGNNAKLSRTPAAAGSASVFTLSCWVKRTLATNYDELLSIDPQFGIRFTNTDKLHVDLYAPDGSSWAVICDSQAVFRDPSAWYSIVLVLDTNAGTTNADRLKLWVNGEPSAFDFTTYWGGLITGNIAKLHTVVEHTIGMRGSSLSGDFLIADYHFIDGQALEPTDFGFYDGQGIWQPKRFTGDYSSGPVYSASSDANGVVSGSGNLSLLFDGNTGTSVVLSQSSSDYAIATQGQSIPVTSTIGMWTTTGASNPTMRVTETDGTVTVLDHNDATIQNNNWTDFSFTGTVAKIELGYIAGSGSSNGFFALRTDGNTLIDASVGRNSFHLDFSDGVKDQSGVGNDWTANNIGLAGGNVDRTSELSENHASGSVTLPYRAFNATYISSKINTSTWAVTTTAWEGAYSAAYAEFRWIPTGGFAVSSSLRVYYGCYDNTQKTTTLTITYTDGSTETDSMTSGSNNWMKLFTASNAAGKTVQKVELSPSTPTATNLQFGGFVIDNAIVESSNPDSDFFVDSPVNGNEASTGAGGQRRGNYCTWSPIDSTGTNTLSNGNLDCSGAQRGNRGTISVTSGKYYYETVITSFGVGGDFGWSKSDEPCPTTDPGANSYGWSVHTSGLKRHNGSTSSYISGGLAVGDVIQFAIDVDAGKVWFGKNNTWGASGDPAAGTNAAFTNVTGPIAPAHGNGGSAIAFTTNFGQRSFSYALPSGFSPLATSFLPEPTIKRGDEAMDVALWAGNSSTQTIGGLGFSPDFAWIKTRNVANDHNLVDIVRGAPNILMSNKTDAEITNSTDGFVSFDSNGFTLGANSLGTQSDELNKTGFTYVGWAWDGGTSTTSVSVGNLNSSVYDQSATWSTSGTMSGFSTSGTYDFAHLFNGVLGADTPGTDNQMTSPSGGSGTWTYTINNVTEFKIRLYVPGSTHATANSIKINGSDIVQAQILDKGLSNDAWHTVTVPGITTFTSLFVEDNYWYVSNIYINGKELVDSGVTVTNVPSIASTVRANPSTGFSIVKATISSAGTIGHGLNAKPHMVFRKRINGTSDWYVAVDTGSVEGYLLLNSTAAITSQSQNFTTSTFDAAWLGNSGEEWINYAFAPVEGYSSFGSYQGNGSDNGPFIYTGFTPKFILTKAYSAGSSSSWHLYDTTRTPNNEIETMLYANLNALEGTHSSMGIDILSNGFKLKADPSGYSNYNGWSYLYAAFSEHPFASNARAR